MLDEIKELKSENLEKRKRLRQTEKTRGGLELKNRQIVEPLARARTDIKELSESYEEFQKEKKIMNGRKKEFVAIEGKLKDAQWKYEVLFQRYQRMEEERDECQRLFEKSTLDLQQQDSFSATLVDKKTKELIVLCRDHINALTPHIPSDTEVSDKLTMDKTEFNDNVSAENLEQIFKRVKDVHTTWLAAMEIGTQRMTSSADPVATA